MRHFVLCAFFVAASPAMAVAEPLSPVALLKIQGDLAGKKSDKAARDVSGMACMPPQGDRRRCLLINDEKSTAQFATLTGRTIAPDETLPLLGEAASPATLGRPPDARCRKAGGYGDLDGEAVAFADGAFYVAGSHGCSRRKGEFRLSAFQLARIGVDAAGRPSGPVQLTYRLGDMLRRAGEAAPYFGEGLMVENGLNVEGVAVVGGTLWVGLRAPSIDGRAFLVGASLSELFAPGREPSRAAPRVVAFAAGTRHGVRDLAALADGRLLALVGPAQDQDVDFALMLIDPDAPQRTRMLGALRPLENGKAEALTILEDTPDGLSVLIGYDGRRNGRFELYRLPLK